MRSNVSPSIYFEGFNAASADRISVAAMVAMEDAASAVSGGAAFHVLNGYDHIANWLLAGCDRQKVMLRLGVVADEIKRSRGAVEVSVSSRAGQSLGPFRARRAVITLPLGLLQAPPDAPGAVRFNPELREKREAAGMLVMGDGNKDRVAFSRGLWEKSRFHSQPAAAVCRHSAFCIRATNTSRHGGRLTPRSRQFSQAGPAGRLRSDSPCEVRSSSSGRR